MGNVHLIAEGLLTPLPGPLAPLLPPPIYQYQLPPTPTFPSAPFLAQPPVTLKSGGIVTTEAKFTAGTKLLKSWQNDTDY